MTREEVIKAIREMMRDIRLDRLNNNELASMYNTLQNFAH